MAFGVSVWHLRGGDPAYEALPPQSSLRHHARNSRDTYGSTDADSDGSAGEYLLPCPAPPSPPSLSQPHPPSSRTDTHRPSSSGIGPTPRRSRRG